MRLLIFGGTTEGRILADRASRLGAEVTVSVDTQVGAEELAGVDSIRVLTGRLDRSGMEALLPGFDLCVDATYPYAKLATAAIRPACWRGVLSAMTRPPERRTFWSCCWPPAVRTARSCTAEARDFTPVCRRDLRPPQRPVLRVRSPVFAARPRHPGRGISPG